MMRGADGGRADLKRMFVRMAIDYDWDIQEIGEDSMTVQTLAENGDMLRIKLSYSISVWNTRIS